jgi:hypothetical protein
MAIMRKVSILAMAGVLAALGLVVTASAEEKRVPGRVEAKPRRSDPFYRALQLAPKRRDEPLRYLNISDYEVREIQEVAAKYLPKVLLNISPVVTGCPCEEGPQCTDQVYIVAETGQSSKGLQLSRVRNAWIVGSVQQWYLRFEELLARRRKMDYLSFERAESELFREFPMCVGELVPAEKTTASVPKAEPKK